MMPARKRANDDDDSWKWTLRSTANRPILRFDDGIPVVVEASQSDHSLKGSLAFMAGGSNEGYGSASDMGTSFSPSSSRSSARGILAFDGSLGYGAYGHSDGILRASYVTGGGETGSPHQLAFTMRRFSGPDLSGASRIAAGAVACRRPTRFRSAILWTCSMAVSCRPSSSWDGLTHSAPTGRWTGMLGEKTVIEYRYATSEPSTALVSKGFDSAPADMSDSGPRMTLMNGAPLLENAHHHEVSMSQRLGDNRFQLAYFRDRIKDPALLGVGDIVVDTGDVLPDVYSGTFSYNGDALEAQGVRFVLQRKLTPDITANAGLRATVACSISSSLASSGTAIHGDLHQAWRHSAALKLNGTVPRWNTEWIVSYRWTSGGALTPVDMFNASCRADGRILQSLRPPAHAARAFHSGPHGSAD